MSKRIKKFLPNNFTIQKFYEGYLQKKGRTAGTIYNEYALILDKDTKN